MLTIWFKSILFLLEAIMVRDISEKIVIHAENFPGNDEPFVIKDHFGERFNPRIGYVGENVKNFFYDLIIPLWEN